MTGRTLKAAVRFAAWLLAGALLAPAAQAQWAPSGVSGQSTAPISDPGKAMALAAGARVLVVGQEDKRLSVVDPDTGSVLRQTLLPHEPRALAVSSDGTRAYVVYGNSKLTAVDLAAGSVIATWTVGGELRSVVLMPGEIELAVADAGPNRLLEVSTTSGAVLRQLPLAHEPRELLRANGDAKLVVGAVNGWLITVDGGSFSVLAQLKLADEIRALAWWEAGARALAVHRRADAVSLFDIAANQVTGTVALDGDPDRAAVAQSSSVGYIATHDDASVNRVDLAGPALLGRYAIAARLNALVFDPAANVLYGALRNDQKLVRLDPAAASLISVLELRKRLRDVAVNPSTHEAVAVADKSDEMFVIKLSDRSVRTIALPARPDLVAVDSALNRAVVAFRGSGPKLRFADLVSNMLFAETIAFDRNLNAIAVDATRALALAIADGERPVLFIDTNSRARLADGAADRYRALAIHSGRGVAYLATEARELKVMDLTTRAITATLELGFKANAIAVDEALDKAVITTDSGNKAHVLNLATLALEANHTLPRHPGALGLQPDTHVAVIASRESDRLSLLDLATNTLTSGFTSVERPHALAVSARYNEALVLSGERDEVAFVQLPNPVPVLESLSPSQASAGSPALVLTIDGKGFVEASRAFFGATQLATRWVSATRLEADVPATLLAAAATVPVTVQNPAPGGGASNALLFNVIGAPELAINTVTPASAEIGATITLLGTGFDPVPAANALVFRGINDTTAPAAALTATPSAITVRVPPLADSGPITLTNSRGTVQSPPFTVVREQDFQLVVSPAALTVYQGAANTAQAQLSSTGTKQFTSLVTLTVQGLPSGVTATFSPAQMLSAFQTGSIDLRAGGAAAPGNYALTVQATSTEGGVSFVRTATLNLTVAAASGVTGVKGRFVTPENQGIAGIIVRADTGQNPQPQTTTDAAGNFQLAGLPAGPVTLRFDATPANPLYPIWPYTATLFANQLTVFPDWTMQPPPPDENFSPINNAAQDQIIRDARYPGLEIKLPAGVTITGWDGVVKTRIAVERYDPDKIGVSPPPIPTRSVFQLYFGTPMGGIPSAPIPITFPNDVGLNPGERTNIWYYDGSPMGGSGEWKIAGQGTVSADGKVVVPDVNAGIPRFCGKCGLGCIQGGQGGGPGNPPCPCTTCPCPPQTSPYPVNYFTGQELPSATDLVINGLIPLELTRAFHPRDPLNNIAGQALSIGLNWSLTYDAPLLPFSGQLVRLVLAGNNQVDFTPDGAGAFEIKNDTRFYGAKLVQLNPSLWELQYKDGRVWRYGPFGGIGVFHLTEQRDANGNSLLISRNPDGRMQSVQAVQRSLAFAYGANGFVSEVTDQIGRKVKYAYNAQNVLQTVTLPDNETIQYTYVDDSEFAPVPACPAPPMGVRLKTIRMPGQSSSQVLFYGPGKRVLRETLPNGEELKFSYKVTGACVTHASNPTVACTVNCPTEDSWDNFAAGWRIVGGQVTATTIVDGEGKATTQRFNSTGVGTESVDNHGQATKYFRDAQNRVTRMTDALGRTWRYAYDANGNRTREADPIGRIIDVTYDPKWNKPTSVTRYLDGRSIVQRFVYDANTGNLLKSFDPLNHETRYTYTARGQLASLHNVALNQGTTLEYNSAGDLVLTRDSLGNESALEPDLVGRTVRSVDALGYATLTEYNAFDQVINITDAKLGITQYNFDGKRDLRGVVNPLARIVESYEYDALHRRTKKTDAKLKSELYTYDLNGNLATLTDRKSQLRTFGYDEQNRLASIDYGSGVTQTRRYDALGRLIEVREPDHVLTFAYDEVDRLVRESTDSANGRADVMYEYDALDRRTKRTVTVNGTLAEETIYAYDDADRLLSQTHRAPGVGASSPRTVAYVWDDGNRLTERTLPNGIKQVFSYDGASRITQIQYRKADDTVLETVSYTYDAAGNRLTRSTGSAAAQDTGFNASYDEANRLTSLTLTASKQTFAFAYDDNGNLISRTDQANPSNVTTYTWDNRNRLVAINAPGMTASFAYDATGRRISKTVAGQTVGYVYDGVQAVGEIANGQASASILSGLAVDEALARFTQAGAKSYFADALMSVLAQAHDDQSILNYYQYSPYGEAVTVGLDEGNPIQYTGRENDGTGLYYYRARYYDPVLKRFISEDPIGMEGGLNFYAYANGNPINNTDPDGLRGTPPPRPQAPRMPLCIRWLCTICGWVTPPVCPPQPPRWQCTRFFVSAPPGQPGVGGFFGPGGYAGNAATMPECYCVQQVLYPF